MATEAKIGYEIFPDRFYSSKGKKGTVNWQTPIEKTNLGKHQYKFYGGDLRGIIEKIGYLEDLGIDFVYSTPIFKAKTNHRYDAVDYYKIDEMLGTVDDLKELLKQLHKRNIRFVLDGVFNHVSLDHEWHNNPEYDSYILKNNKGNSYWFNVHFLPELNLENHELREILWNGEDSVIKKWTNIGVDDWRIDCAYDIGFKYCKEITDRLKEMGDHNSIGEVWAYPKEWVNYGVLDGVMNYYFTELVGAYIKGEVDSRSFSKAVENTQKDCGIDGLLKSWNILSTHDTPRLRRIYRDKWKLAVALQFTLPGSPLIYYGEELGITSDGDPYCRQPMPWELANSENESLNFYKSMIALFRRSEALKKGVYEKVIVTNDNVLVFLRKTEKIEDMKIIVINPTDESQDYRAILRESRLMNNFPVVDHFSGKEVKVANSTIADEIPANSFYIYYPKTKFDGYSPYKRIIQEDNGD